MDDTKIQDILPFLEQPSRYLGTETHRFRKDRRRIRLHMALAFPDLYEIGMSHFGIQILYHILNQDPQIFAERVFAPGEDLARRLNAEGIPLTTLESRTPLHRLDIVGFSLLYELNYTNVLYMLDLGKIPFLSADRSAGDPLVIAGGPCTCNPEPVADLFDAMVIGEAEGVIQDMARVWLSWKDEGDGGRESLLKQWSQIEGVYIPSFYRPVYDAKGFQHLEPRDDKGVKTEKIVRRAVVPDLTAAPFPLNPVMPFGKPIHDRLRLEIARGCTRGCRFCQAGILYRPVRERSPEGLLEMAQKSLSFTGYDNVSLLSLSTGDYSALGYLMEHLMDRCEGKKVALSLPSFRAGTLTPKLMQQIQRVRKTGFTIAPEAGSQRLRDIVNKNLSETEILETVKNAFSLGWQAVKLYFMVGLPFETDADLEAIVSLVQKMNKFTGAKHPRGKGKRAVHVSVATFIPKPHTPFQWASQTSLDGAREKIDFLKRVLRDPRIQLKWQNPEVSLLEGLWARGDRRLCRLLIHAYQQGCRFDGWTDHFRFDRWEAAVARTGIDIDFFTTRRRRLSEPLPWDPFDMGVSRRFLEEEWEKAQKGFSTPDCRGGECHGCGVCDFETLQPRIHPRTALDAPKETRPSRSEERAPLRAYRVLYSKTGPARYFGHLEMVKLILQGIRRAEIPVAHTQGFHPKPKVAFANPLPVGMESEKEAFILWTTETLSPSRLAEALSPKMPEGITISGCASVSPTAGIPVPPRIRYRIMLTRGQFDAAALEAFQNAEKWPWEETDRNGRLKTYELKRMVPSTARVAPHILDVTIENRSGKTLRPDVWIRAVFRFDEETIKRMRIIKRDDGSQDV